MMTSRSTGKERDAESGLDYFGARYYANTTGRFTSVDPITLTATRLQDPQGLNLYSYTRNRPTIAVDDGGLATVVVLVGQNQTANITVHSNLGLLRRSYSGLARGQHRNRMGENGDTPFGSFKITGTSVGKPLGPAYGMGKIFIQPVSGEAKTSGRKYIWQHGGGSNAKLVPDPYADSQPLIGTHGCIRMHNKDVIDEAGVLQEEGIDGDDYLYVGNEMSLKIMALTNYDLRRALNQRNQFLGLDLLSLYARREMEKAEKRKHLVY